MSSEPRFERSFQIEGGDFRHAGSVSIAIRKILKDLGMDAETIRRVAIVSYEAEMNIVLYAERGEVNLKVFDDRIRIEIEDMGPGIENIEMALQNGYSTATTRMRELGFGAGMGLPNIKRNADDFSISSTPAEGTRLSIEINVEEAIRS